MPPQSALQAAAELINKGSKVAILAGRGCLNAREEVLELAKTVAGPIVKPLLGKAVVPDRSPYTTGGIGLLGTAPSQDALQECDTLIIAGSSFPYMEFYPKPGKAKTVQIDIAPTRIGLRHPVDVGLIGDCRTVLRALLPLLESKEGRLVPEEIAEAHGELEQADGGARHAHRHADEAAGRHVSLEQASDQQCDCVVGQRHYRDLVGALYRHAR